MLKIQRPIHCPQLETHKEVPTNPFLEILRIPHPLKMISNVLQVPQVMPYKPKQSVANKIPILSLNTENKVQSFQITNIMTHNFDRIESKLRVIVERIEEEIPTDSEVSEKGNDEIINEYNRVKSDIVDDKRREQESVKMLEREHPILDTRMEIMDVEGEKQTTVVNDPTEYKKKHSHSQKKQSTRMTKRKGRSEVAKKTQHQKEQTQIANEFYEGTEEGIPKNVVPNPIGTGIERSEYFQDEHHMISEQYSNEEMKSSAINKELEASLISCLMPLQLSKPKREYLSVETM